MNETKDKPAWPLSLPGELNKLDRSLVLKCGVVNLTVKEMNLLTTITS
jgi:hypothetical protein